MEINQKQIIETSKVEIEGRLYEEIYNPETCEASFVFYNEKTQLISEIEYIDDGDIRYVPLVDKFVKIKAVVLPLKAEEYESEERLLQDIQSFIHKYLDISEEDELICTWTVPYFWLYDKVNVTLPYLRALGDTGCGKSQFLDVIGGISYKTMMVGGSITPAILYRVAEKWKGTMIIDEADWKNTDEYSEVAKIINCNQPNRRILRCKSDNYDDIEAFNPWCPKIFATRRIFHDIATESRMLTIQMKETSRDDIPVVLDDEFNKEQSRLRNQLLTYRLKNWNRVNSSIKPDINLKGIEPRGKQIMYPISIVFNQSPEILEKLREIMIKRQGEIIKERSSTIDGTIVNVYLELINSGQEFITASDIVNMLKERGNDKITSQNVGHRMRSLGFTNKNVNLKGKTKRCYNCDNELLNKLKRRYELKPEEQEDKNYKDYSNYSNTGGWQKIKNILKGVK